MLPKDCIISDIASVKTGLKKFYEESGFRYVSSHPMFGPTFASLSNLSLSLIHIFSQWGYDFRPAYLKIAEIRTLLPGIPVLALTATATPEVVKDIQARLDFREAVSYTHLIQIHIYNLFR